MIVFAAMIGVVRLISEEGYLYSVHTDKFLSYKASEKESRVFLADKKNAPRKFRIEELGGNNFGYVKIVVAESDKENLVLDLAAELLQYEHHGGSNQRWKLQMVPKMMIKLRAEKVCIEARSSDFYLRPAPCKIFEDSPGQYFRWIPVQLEKAINNDAGHERAKRTNGNPNAGGDGLPEPSPLPTMFPIPVPVPMSSRSSSLPPLRSSQAVPEAETEPEPQPRSQSQLQPPAGEADACPMRRAKKKVPASDELVERFLDLQNLTKDILVDDREPSAK